MKKIREGHCFSNIPGAVSFRYGRAKVRNNTYVKSRER